MICMFKREEQTYIFKDKLEPDIRLSVFAPINFPLLVSAGLADSPPWLVCSTNVLPAKFPREPIAEEVLGTFRAAFKQFNGLGGARVLSEDDQTSCKLRLVAEATTAAAGQASGTVAASMIRLAGAERCVPLVKAHPAWRGGLGFMCADFISPGLVDVLNDIYDIRRFEPRAGEGRMRNNLRSYFRLIKVDDTIRAQDKAQCGAPVKAAEQRLLSLMETWNAPLSSFSEAMVAQLPHLFLQREWDDHFARFQSKNVSEDKAIDLSTYRCTLRALEFINLTWLSGLGQLSFDPHKFFRKKVEAAAFEDYLSRIS